MFHQKTTVERMAIELGVISDLQASEFLYSNQNITLAFDATTQEGVHINVISVHIEKGRQEYALSIEELPGGTAQDYADHICRTIDYLSKLYGTCTGVDPNTVKE